MRYVESRIEDNSTAFLYRGFVTEGVKIITKNTASIGGGEVMKMNFIEFRNGRKKHAEERDPHEIIKTISDKLDALGGNE